MPRGRHSNKFARNGGRKVAAAIAKAKHSKEVAVVKKVVKAAETNLDMQIAEKWKAGQTIGQLATEYSKKRSQIRRSITVAVGGKDEFRKLRSAGSGGTHVPFGGKRSGGRTREAIALDDSKVPVLQSKDLRLRINGRVISHLEALHAELVDRLNGDADSSLDKLRLETGRENARKIVAQAKTDRKWKGWSVEHYQTATGSALRLFAPDGKSYVRATPTERADYVVQGELLSTRWKIESEARMAKVEAKQQEQIEKGTAALKATRAKKRAARQARKAGKSPSTKKRRSR